MDVEKFVTNKHQKLIDAVSENCPFINFNTIQKLLRSKDIKINGKRVNKPVICEAGDVVEIYYEKQSVEIAFEDENIVVAVKPRQIETCSQDEKTANVQKNNENYALKSSDLQNFVQKTLQSELEKQLNAKLYAVHRLDRNTSGLVVFAKNVLAKKSLDNAIKSRQIQKFYLAQVKGFVKGSQKCVAYLKKDEEASKVYISDTPKNGYQKIETDFWLHKKMDDSSIIKVLLVTGKTHQIRAHLAHLGHPVLGDMKYGDAEFNKLHGKHFQCLTASEIVFNFESGDYLAYLNGKHIQLDENKIDFLK